MKVYIAGPMTYIPQYNFPAFDSMAEMLRSRGHDVVSPAELDDPADRAAALASPDGAPQTAHHFGKSWGDFLARDVKLLSDGGIEAVVVLPGWQKSRGARLETFVAHAMNGIPVLYPDPNWPYELHKVSRLSLYRAWCANQHIVLRPAPFSSYDPNEEMARIAREEFYRDREETA